MRAQSAERVLVTGATGFIGQHVLPFLQMRGTEIHAITSRRPLPAQPGVIWHQADIFDLHSVAILHEIRPTHLLHLAWYAAPGDFWTSKLNLVWLEASLRWLRAFGEAGGRRVVGAGTCGEYDWAYGFCSESATPLAPRTLYGTCKHALQQVLAVYAQQVDLSAAWGRVFFAFGPREQPSRLVASVMRAVLRGEPALCSHGAQIRDYLHARDVASAFVALLFSDVSGPVNIGSGNPITLAAIVEWIGQAAGRPDLIRLGALPSPADEPPVLLADVRRLRHEVHWSPSISLEAGLSEALAWWKDQT